MHGKEANQVLVTNCKTKEMEIKMYASLCRFNCPRPPAAFEPPRTNRNNFTDLFPASLWQPVGGSCPFPTAAISLMEDHSQALRHTEIQPQISGSIYKVVKLDQWLEAAVEKYSQHEV